MSDNKIEPIHSSDTVKLNEKSMSREEFEEKKRQLEEKKGVSVEKVSEDSYRIKIQG